MSEIVIHSRQVEMVPIEALKGYDRNARSHPASQVQVLANIVRERGWTNPLLIDDDDVIVAGHGRIEVARKLKMTEVPCVRLSGLTPEQIREVRISDNQTALLSGWDDVLLKLELGELQGLGIDLSLTGFSSLELTGIFSTQEGSTDPDTVPDVPAQPVTQPGDLWRLGDHWLICGDSTDKETVERVLQGQRPHLMVTDPPFGVDYDPEWRDRAAEFSPSMGNRKDTAKGVVMNDHRADWREAWALFPGDVAYVWHADKGASITEIGLKVCGFETRALIIWNKSHLVVGRGHYHSKHEAAWYMVRKGANGHWSGDRKQTTVWDIDKPQKSETGHGTQKPVECMARPLRNNSQPGDRIFEPFAGSFTTGIAAQMNKRIVHAIELDPKYVDVGILRWEQFTGQKATLDGDGRTFEEISAARREVV
jgi:DNA modification methylase